MTLDEHVKAVLGDLLFTLARQAAEIDALKAQLAQAPPTTDASDTPGFQTQG
jgi:hypothetical protein